MKDALEYFKANIAEIMKKYEGEYVAIVNNRLVSHGKDAKKVYGEARKQHPEATVFLGQVPKKEAMVL